MELSHWAPSGFEVEQRSLGLCLGPWTHVSLLDPWAGRTAPGPGMRCIATGSQAVSGSTAETKVSRVVTQGMDTRDSSWDPWWLLLVAGPRPNRTIGESIEGWQWCLQVCSQDQDWDLASQLGISLLSQSNPPRFGSTGVSPPPTWVSMPPQRHFCPWMAKLLLWCGDMMGHPVFHYLVL